jgi:hypothetical protein
MVESPFMTDELVEVAGKSGPYVVWRTGTNGELVVAAPSGGLPFAVPYQDVKRWGSASDNFREFSRKAFRRVTKRARSYRKPIE